MKNRPMLALVGTEYELKPQRGLSRLRWAEYGLDGHALDYTETDGAKVWFMLRWSSPDINWVTCEALARFDALWSGRFTDLCRSHSARFVVDWHQGILTAKIVFSDQMQAVAEVPLTIEHRSLQ